MDCELPERTACHETEGEGSETCTQVGSHTRQRLQELSSPVASQPCAVNRRKKRPLPCAGCQGPSCNDAMMAHVERFLSSHVTEMSEANLWRAAAHEATARCGSLVWSADSIRLHFTHHAIHARLEAIRRYRAVSKVRRRLARRVLQSPVPLDAKLLARFLRAVEAEGKLVVAALSPSRAAGSSPPRKRRLMSSLTRQARPVPPPPPPVELPLDASLLRLSAFVRMELVECTPDRAMPQPTLADLWQRRDDATWRHAAALRLRVTNQVERRCNCSEQCRVGLAAVRTAFSKDDPAAAASVEQHGLALDDMVRRSLELPATQQRTLYGFRWAKPPQMPAGRMPDLEAVRRRAEARRPVAVEWG